MKHVLVVYMQKNNRTLNEVKKVLKEKKIKFKAVNRTDLKKPIKDYDLIITVGGDGTFLRTSHFVFCKIPMLGVNADPTKKEGFFTRSNKENFRNVISRALNIKKLTRLEVKINNKLIPDYPLNEVFIGHYKPYQMSHIEVDGHEYRCSGVLASTPAGSYSWAKSAGGAILPLFSEKFEYVLLDAYEGNIYKVKHPYKILPKNKSVKIKPAMAGCIVVIDSLSKEYHLKKNDVLTVSRSTCPIYFVDGNE